MRAQLVSSICLLLILFSSATASDDEDNLALNKRKLRELLYLPAVYVQFNFGKLVFDAPKLNDAEKARQRIVELKGQLKGDPSDAERYVELIDLVGKLNDQDERRQICQKAVDS